MQVQLFQGGGLLDISCSCPFQVKGKCEISLSGLYVGVFRYWLIVVLALWPMTLRDR